MHPGQWSSSISDKSVTTPPRHFRLSSGKEGTMRAVSAALIVLFAPFGATAQDSASYSIDPQQSKVEIHVGKQGAFSAFGHDHLITAKKVPGKPSLMRRSSNNLPYA